VCARGDSSKVVREEARLELVFYRAEEEGEGAAEAVGAGSDGGRH
jgi:hypothetical protein